MLIESTEQLRALTGNYYANNDFTKIQGDLQQAAAELEQLVGEGVMQKATQADEGDPLRLKVQRPVALLATLRMYQKNDLSHEDDGRKFKVSTDGQDKLPWEWQLDRDDALQMEAYYRAVDDLVRYLDREQPEEWTRTDAYRLRQTLIIRSGAQLASCLPSGGGERMYLLLLPFLREAQVLTVQPAYGNGWDDLLADTTVPQPPARWSAQMATALLAMSAALRRLPLGLLPGGVVKGYLAENGMRGTQPATLDDVRRVSCWMQADAARHLEHMKRLRDDTRPDYELTPRNHPANKYCRL